MRRIMAIAALLAAPGDLSAQGKGIRLWNLTSSTISGFQLSPSGKNAWGPNQTLNDKDKEVDHDERLRITAIETGALRCQGVLSELTPVPGPRYRNQGGCGVFNRRQGLEGLHQLACSDFAHHAPTGVILLNRMILRGHYQPCHWCAGIRTAI